MPLLKETPKEAEIASHRLMLRAGMIRQQAAGIYSWLPLGLRVLNKINAIIREEMNRAGANEILMPTLQSADLWRESGRYDAYGKEMLRIEDRHKRDLLYGPTNEEMVTDIFRSYVASYKSLPLNLYHIQWKFRDEVRPRFGLMRGREFLMKDAYSFDLDEASARTAYHRMFVAYLRTFDRLGLRAIPMRADTGPIGGDLSHEFIILADTGESEVFFHTDYNGLEVPGEGTDFDDADALAKIVADWSTPYAATDEIHDEAEWAKVPGANQATGRGIEVGHIFYFGTKYSDAMGAKVTGPDGQEHPVHMGSYGIGPSRVAAAAIEAGHDDDGIIWPGAIAPFNLGIISMKPDDAAVAEAADKIYRAAQAGGYDPLLDDRDMRAGQKFAAMDLVGVPEQITVGPRGLEKGEVEVKKRCVGDKMTVSLDETLNRLAVGAN
jgi:prolyl-tRNA synthetase